jgi:hypothetical protein
MYPYQGAMSRDDGISATLRAAALAVADRAERMRAGDPRIKNNVHVGMHLVCRAFCGSITPGCAQERDGRRHA